MALILPNTIANNTPADGDRLEQNFSTIEDWANQNAIQSDGSVAMQAPLLLPGPPVAQNQAATKGYVDSSVPIGAMYMYCGDVEPTNWMFCRGQAISRATYSVLFSLVNVRFGAGDTVTTFNIPDMRGRTPFGFNQGGAYLTVGVGERFGNQNAIVPQHKHASVTDHLHGTNGFTSDVDVNHFHSAGASPGGAAAGFVAAYSPPAGTLPMKQAVGAELVLANVHWAYTPATGYMNVNNVHHHSVGAADRPLETSVDGVDPTNGNLPPLVTFNFMIKVL